MKKLIYIIILCISNYAWGQTNQGTEFYLTFLPAYVQQNEADYDKLFLYITSHDETLVKVSIPSKDYYEEQLTIPNDIIVFEFSPTLAQPYVKQWNEQPQNDKVYEKIAIHITSDEPISIYALTRYKHTSDAYLALPVEILGEEYIVASYGTINNGRSPSELAIIGTDDDTRVTFTLGGNEYTRTMSGLKPGERQTRNLNKGDVWLISGNGDLSDLSGSIVSADKPVGVISGHYCAYVPMGTPACDCLSSMELSTDDWSHEIIVPNIFKRKKGSIIKVFAKEPHTKIFRDGVLLGTIRKAGGVEGEGYFHIRTNLGDSRPIIISGDKPISVTLFNTGQEDDKVQTDPFQMVLAPLALFQYNMLFATPGLRGVEGFSENYVALVFSSEDGLIPNHFYFGALYNNSFNWHQLNSLFDNTNIMYAGELFGKQYYIKTIFLPDDGVYGIRAAEPFMSYSYGFSEFDSYGFPSSMTKLIPQEAIIQAGFDDFPVLTCDDFVDKPIRILNEGDGMLVVMFMELKGQDADEFAILEESPIFIEPYSFYDVNLRFSPDSPGDKSAELIITSNSVNVRELSIPVSAKKEDISFTCNISYLDLGKLSYNQSANGSFILINTGSIEHTYSISTKGILEISPNSVTLQPQEEATINVYFPGSEEDLFINEEIIVLDELCNLTTKIETELSVYVAYIEVSAATVSAYPGEEVSINIILDNQKNVDLTEISKLSFDLYFNHTLLYPLDFTAERIDDFTSKIRIEDIPISYQQGDILTSVKFKVGLGNSEQCDIVFSDIQIIGGTASVSFTNGVFNLLGVCYDGGARLLNPAGTDELMSISPNPSSNNIRVELALIEDGETTLTIYDVAGKSYFDTVINSSSQNLELDIMTDKFPLGTYFIVLRTPTITRSKKLFLIR